MDFLEIRKKAKERARAGAGGSPAKDAPAAAEAAQPAAPAPGEPPPRKGGRRRRATPPPRAGEPADLAARLQELPPAVEPAGGLEPAAPPGDDRFTTWRPGDGAPPFVPPPPALGPLAPPHEDDFKVIVAPSAQPAAAAPQPEAPAAALDPLDEFFYRPDEEAPQLPQLGPATAAREEPRAVAREEYLTFLLGGEEYAVAIERVREVIRAPPVTEVPRAPAHIVGVISVRGEIVAVIDPRRRLGLPPGGPPDGERKVVIVDAGEGPCGLLVDGVANVVRLVSGSIEPCPQGVAAQGSECLAGIGREADRLFTLLDLGGVLRRMLPRGSDGASGRRADASA